MKEYKTPDVVNPVDSP